MKIWINDLSRTNVKNKRLIRELHKALNFNCVFLNDYDICINNDLVEIYLIGKKDKLIYTTFNHKEELDILICLLYEWDNDLLLMKEKGIIG